jgi:hypothetical protein
MNHCRVFTSHAIACTSQIRRRWATIDQFESISHEYVLFAVTNKVAAKRESETANTAAESPKRHNYRPLGDQIDCYQKLVAKLKSRVCTRGSDS